ncbi:MAG: methylenetetrahydrofolate reductase [Desulfovibrionaceae bacterium]|nr:methylenetetrahydrofolate reductase [Desulfovibrionaceae bacterium]
MRIVELIERRGGPFISLEFFPPKDRDAWPGFFEVVDSVRAVDPLFASVTYGAGGGTQDNTLEIARRIKAGAGLEPLVHLTSVGASSARIEAFLSELEKAGIDNVLALRGDPPRGTRDFDFDSQEFRHASDLVAFIRARCPEMCVGVAGYPHPHPESPSVREDLRWMKHKLDQGARFVVTQLFFDNRIYFDFVDRLRDMGARAPVVPGILPIMSLKSAKFVLSLCSAAIPGDFLSELERAFEQGGDDAVYRLGLDYAVNQAQGLIDGGAPGVHLYTLNRAEACLEIAGKLKL